MLFFFLFSRITFSTLSFSFKLRYFPVFQSFLLESFSIKNFPLFSLFDLYADNTRKSSTMDFPLRKIFPLERFFLENDLLHFSPAPRQSLESQARVGSSLPKRKLHQRCVCQSNVLLKSF